MSEHDRYLLGLLRDASIGVADKAAADFDVATGWRALSDRIAYERLPKELRSLVSPDTWRVAVPRIKNGYRPLDRGPEQQIFPVDAALAFHGRRALGMAAAAAPASEVDLDGSVELPVLNVDDCEVALAVFREDERLKISVRTSAGLWSRRLTLGVKVRSEADERIFVVTPGPVFTVVDVGSADETPVWFAVECVRWIRE